MEGGTVEEVDGRGNVFHWKLEQFSKRVDYRYISPVFDVSGRRWFLAFYPDGEKRNQPMGNIGLELWPYESDTPVKAQYSLGISTMKGVAEIWKYDTTTFHRFCSHVWCTGIHRCELLLRRDDLVPQDILTITVTLWVVSAGSSQTGFTTSTQLVGYSPERRHTHADAATTNPTGTTIKFNPPTDTDVVERGGVAVGIVRITLQCITCMTEYENNSLEELRFADYAVNRKTAGGITFGGTTQQTSGLFGKIIAISTSGFSFGSTTQSKTLFGTIGTKSLKNASVQATVQGNVADVSVQTEVEDSITGGGKGEPSEKTGPDKIVEDVGKLWPNGDYTDVLLKVRDVEFKAHRTILAARAPALGSMFHHETAEKTSGEASIDDCEPEVFEQLLHYIYKGAPRELTAENASALYIVADKYLVSELKVLCVWCMRDSLCLDTFCDTLTLSLMYREDELLNIATDFLSKNMIDVMKTVEWQRFMRDHLTWANEILMRATQLTAARYEKEKRELVDQSMR